jgi:hypothetical protein
MQEDVFTPVSPRFVFLASGKLRYHEENTMICMKFYSSSTWRWGFKQACCEEGIEILLVDLVTETETGCHRWD